ncbi:MAG: hypothetical protein A2474_03735 [Elusimicrobia bacterium RIFOXYC2_FULL_34_12]|nr:MAG: hypothetical protein A2474_03735 [Elusimicrobia bacterium RIFOXYC2_FULL_34_12]HAM39544.1 hypothetical protein [Elusimicrobiota bacterium]
MKNKQNLTKTKVIQPSQNQEKMLSKRGKTIIFVGIGILILGYIILTKTNPQGDNWASIISPFLLVGGYITVAIGIIS